MKIKSSAPGRICLFGEHQDYLGFPVIAAAIDLRISITGEVSEGDRIRVDLPDINKTLEFTSQNITYSDKKDYLKSAVNVLKKKNLFTPKTIDAVLNGTIPIQAGTSSSAALSTAWIGFLLAASKSLQIAYTPADRSAIAELAYLAEVEEFNESGGRMDQYTSALGGIVYLDFYKTMTVDVLPAVVKEFVLGDSREPKDTQETLKRVRTAQEEAFRHLARHLTFKDNFYVTYEEAAPFLGKIHTESRPYLEAALINHRITDQARDELLRGCPEPRRIADLMNRHQHLLRDNLKVSTPKIDAMIDKALEAGALSAKINGSGEGGCMFAFCPGKQPEVAESIRRAGGIPYIIDIGTGLEVNVGDSL